MEQGESFTSAAAHRLLPVQIRLWDYNRATVRNHFGKEG